jgi:hypothetical protein
MAFTVHYIICAAHDELRNQMLICITDWFLPTTDYFSLFRYNCGAAANYVANKRARHYNAPGPPQYPGGTICGK